jgi:hypothetical protein
MRRIRVEAAWHTACKNSSREEPGQGGVVSERSVVVLGALVGAALGGVAGYLFLTERGRQLRDEIEPRVYDLMRELGALQGTLTRARDAVSDGLRAVGQASSDEVGQSPGASVL